MDVSDLVNGLCESSEELKATDKAREKAKKVYEEAFQQLEGYIKIDFEQYLIDHPEIPEEKYTLQLLNKDQLYPNEGAGKITNLFTPENVFVKVVFGKQEEPDAHDFAPEPPVDVSAKFKDFVDRNKPLDIKVVRYFNENNCETYYAYEEFDPDKAS